MIDEESATTVSLTHVLNTRSINLPNLAVCCLIYHLLSGPL